MTDRLTVLLARESAAIEVPNPRPDLVIRRARTTQKRRRALRGMAALSAAALVATIVGLIQPNDRHGAPASAQDQFEQAAAVPAYGTYGAFAAGRTVYIGNHRVSFKEQIKQLYYTSVGVLVRMGDHSYLVDPGPSRYVLIRPNGSVREIASTLGDRVPATDPDSPDVAYVERAGDKWSIIVMDVRTSKEIARKTVDGSFTPGNWEAPPATISGTRVWALFDEGWLEFDWERNTTRLIPNTRGASLEAAHGRYVATLGDQSPTLSIAEFVTGRSVRNIPAPNTGFHMSPDGRFLRLDGTIIYDGNKLISAEPSSFLDLNTGHTIKIPAHVVYGWTPKGHTLSINAAKNRVTVCSPKNGHCAIISVPIGRGRVKLGGSSYES